MKKNEKRNTWSLTGNTIWNDQAYVRPGANPEEKQVHNTVAVLVLRALQDIDYTLNDGPVVILVSPGRVMGDYPPVIVDVIQLSQIRRTLAQEEEDAEPADATEEPA